MSENVDFSHTLSLKLAHHAGHSNRFPENLGISHLGMPHDCSISFNKPFTAFSEPNGSFGIADCIPCDVDWMSERVRESSWSPMSYSVFLVFTMRFSHASKDPADL